MCGLLLLINAGFMRSPFPVLCRVLAAVDGVDPVQLFLRVPPPSGQAEDPAAAEAEGDQPDRLQRGLQLPFLNAGPQYVHLLSC